MQDRIYSPEPPFACISFSFPPSCRSACHGEAKVTLVDRSCVPATRARTHQGQWLRDGCLREWRFRHVARGINLSGWENVRCTALRLQTAKNGHALRAPADRLMLLTFILIFFSFLASMDRNGGPHCLYIGM